MAYVIVVCDFDKNDYQALARVHSIIKSVILPDVEERQSTLVFNYNFVLMCNEPSGEHENKRKSIPESLYA
jgi:hypothetical protein